MSYIVVDVESDGEIIGTHSMVCFGAVLVNSALDQTFYGQTKPISDIWKPEALAISGFSREEHWHFDDPADVMKKFAQWLFDISKATKPILISDNNGYDAAWINYYFHRFYGKNPFGWSSRRIGDLYCGMKMDARAQWKQLREAPHNHNPVSDALGNAQALLKMKEMGLKIKFE
jgi:hypothetical protein